MSLQQSLEAFIREEQLFTKNDRLLVAVSGGADSVVLCHVCRAMGFDIVMAHCNFRLRGEESERDETFVRTLAAQWQVPVVVQHFDTREWAAAHGLSIQEAARKLRYDWFDEVLAQKVPEATGCRWLLTAHHADDNIETLLMNFFRGTGIQGLRGILPKQGHLIRPLLPFHKTALLDYAATHQLQWVEDSSNALDKYSRNYIRHQVMPLMKQLYPDAEQNLAASLPRFREVELLYRESVERYKKKLLEYRGNEVHIPVLKLKQATAISTLLYEITKDYGFSAHQAAEVVRLLDSETGKYVQSASHRILKNRRWLIIAPLQTSEAATILIEKEDESVVFEEGRLIFTVSLAKDLTVSSDEQTACLDASQVKFPLILRKWKAGDYFYPLGMRKKKKLARFFIDQKLSKTAKEKVWVLEMDKKIIWIPGHRIDDRFKTTPATKEILLIRLLAHP